MKQLDEDVKQVEVWMIERDVLLVKIELIRLLPGLQLIKLIQGTELSDLIQRLI